MDLSCTYIAWLAKKRDIEIIELAEEGLGINWTFSFNDLHTKDGIIKCKNLCYKFSEINGVYVRFHPQPPIPSKLDLPPEEIGTFIAERRSALEYFLNCFPETVVNRPMAGRSNGSKPYQMNLLSKAGFLVPCWMITNEEKTIRKFQQECNNDIIYKSCSGYRSRVRLLEGNEIFEKLRHGSCPILFQEYVQGYDVRIHVVNKHIFATKIVSDNGIDYRFEGSEKAQYEETSVPGSIKKLCYKTMNCEKLVIGGFDFRVTEDNVWYCLEVNPVPTFLPYEMETGQMIGDAILDSFTHMN